MQHDLIAASGKLVVKTKRFKPHVVGNHSDKKGTGNDSSTHATISSRWFSTFDQWKQPMQAKSKAREKGRRKGKSKQKMVRDKRTKTCLCQKWEESGGMVSCGALFNFLN